MKVYIPHVPTRFDRATESRVPSFDLNPARQYGEFVRLLDPDHLVTAHTLPSDIATVCEGMEDYGPEDAILCVGDVILIAAAIARANELCGTAKVLRWDRNKKSYDLVGVSL